MVVRPKMGSLVTPGKNCTRSNYYNLGNLHRAIVVNAPIVLDHPETYTAIRILQGSSTNSSSNKRMFEGDIIIVKTDALYLIDEDYSEPKKSFEIWF
jgi:hypothetical protein